MLLREFLKSRKCDIKLIYTYKNSFRSYVYENYSKVALEQLPDYVLDTIVVDYMEHDITGPIIYICID